jgi:hypothetical protein
MSGDVPPLLTYLHGQLTDNFTVPLSVVFVRLNEHLASSTHDSRRCMSVSITAGSKPRPEDQRCLIKALKRRSC